MAILQGAISLGDPMDSKEVLDYVIPLGPLLETDEAAGSMELVLLPEATALGLEIIEGDLVYPDPELVEDDTAVRLWFRIDAEFIGDTAFAPPGSQLPIELTITTTTTPPRIRQRTFYLTVKEQ